MKQGLKSFYKKYAVYVWCVGVSSVFMLATWFFNKIGPFGEHTMLLVDGIHQYTPFFSEYCDKILHGGSFSYTWNVGMGVNFLALFSYYLSSPLNLLILLAGKNHMSWAISFVLTLKIIMTAPVMAYYLRHKKGKRADDMIIVALSLAYAFNNYMVGYNWCTMWMDTILILPLILLGFEYLMERKDYRLYVICLFYGLFCNYYIGFIVCVFLIFWFFLYEHGGIKNFFMHGIRFAIGSLLAGGMTAVLLLPAYYGIMNTASAGAELPESNFYGNVCNILKQLFIAVQPIKNQVFDGGANLYCGMLALFGALLFLFTREISLWKRCRYLLMLVFLVVSMNNELLNFIWHAFHNQYGIPNRFSFLFILLLILMAEQAFAYTDKSDKKVNMQLLTTALLIIGTVLLYRLADEKLPLYCYIISVALVDVYCVILYCCSTGKMKRSLAMLLLGIVGFVEIMGNATYGFAYLGSVDTAQYLQDTDAVKELKHYMDEHTAGSFYRADILKSRMLDEATWHNLPSIGIFGSTVPGELVSAMNKFGFYTGANEYLYHGATPLTNALFGVRYVIIRDDAYNNLDFDYVKETDGVMLYENPYPLPVAFMTDSELIDYEFSSSDQFSVQNDIAWYMTGVEDELFYRFWSDIEASCDNGSAYADPDTSVINYERDNTEETVVTGEFTVPEDMDLYLNCRGSNIKNLTIYLDGEQLAKDRYQTQLFHVGNVKANQRIMVDFLLNSGGDLDGTLNLCTASYDKYAFARVYEDLADNTLEDVRFSDGYLEGSIDVKRSGLLFTSIPHDKGWRVYVDGKETEILTVCKAFMGIELKKGRHKIEFRYTTEGLKYGIILSTICWCIFIGLAVICGLRRKKEVFQVEKASTESDYSGSGAGDAVPSGDESDSQGDAADS